MGMTLLYTIFPLGKVNQALTLIHANLTFFHNLFPKQLLFLHYNRWRSYEFFNHLMPQRNALSFEPTTVELHQTGTLEGCSTD